MTQEAEAAAMKMFGNLTRTVKPFYPNRIVCKRFNVRNPHPNHDPTADADVGRSQAGNKDALSKESMESMLNERLPLKFVSENQPKPDDVTMKAVIPKPSERVTDQSAPSTGVDKEVVKDEEEEGPPLDYERPSMDIFKAIFDDSDSDESDEEENTENQPTQDVAEEDALIGPAPPPPVATIDIPIEKKSAESLEPFRPIFKRASERKEHTVPLTNVVSEEFIVQPFKPRASGHKRRHVSISEGEEEDDRSSSRHDKSSRHTHSKSSRRRSRSRDIHSGRSDKGSREKKHKKSSRDEERRHRSSRDEEKSHRSSRDEEKSHKSSRDEEKGHRSSRDEEKSHRSSRKRSKSPGKHKSNRKRSRSPDGRKHKSKREASPHKYIKTEEDYEGFWVEKEPVIPTQASSSNKKGSRKSAADMW